MSPSNSNNTSKSFSSSSKTRHYKHNLLTHHRRVGGLRRRHHHSPSDDDRIPHYYYRGQHELFKKAKEEVTKAQEQLNKANDMLQQVWEEIMMNNNSEGKQTENAHSPSHFTTAARSKPVVTPASGNVDHSYEGDKEYYSDEDDGMSPRTTPARRRLKDAFDDTNSKEATNTRDDSSVHSISSASINYVGEENKMDDTRRAKRGRVGQEVARKQRETAKGSGTTKRARRQDDDCDDDEGVVDLGDRRGRAKGLVATKRARRQDDEDDEDVVVPGERHERVKGSPTKNTDHRQEDDGDDDEVVAPVSRERRERAKGLVTTKRARRQDDEDDEDVVVRGERHERIKRSATTNTDQRQEDDNDDDDEVVAPVSRERRERVKWSVEERVALIAACYWHQLPGREVEPCLWKSCRRLYGGLGRALANRDNVQLKDGYRTLYNQGIVECSDPKGLKLQNPPNDWTWDEVDEVLFSVATYGPRWRRIKQRCEIQQHWNPLDIKNCFVHVTKLANREAALI